MDIRAYLTGSLTDLAAAIEQSMAYPEGCPAIVEGVTHCESCGFHYSAPRHVVTHRNRCQTPEVHPL